MPKKKEMSIWHPIRDMVNLREDFDRLSGSFFGGLPEMREDLWTPVVDVEETNGNIEVKAEIPGVKKDDIKVAVRNNMLEIAGERKHEEEKRDKAYHHIERSYGSFRRIIGLPADVDENKVKATYNDGLLQVTMPRPESAKRKQIDVEVG